MGCVSSNSKDADKEAYGSTTMTPPQTEKSAAVGPTRSEPEVGYDVTRETVKVSRDAGDAQSRPKKTSSSSSTSSYQRRRTAEQPMPSDVTEQVPSSVVSSPYL